MKDRARNSTTPRASTKTMTGESEAITVPAMSHHAQTCSLVTSHRRYEQGDQLEGDKTGPEPGRHRRHRLNNRVHFELPFGRSTAIRTPTTKSVNTSAPVTPGTPAR